MKTNFDIFSRRGEVHGCYIGVEVLAKTLGAREKIWLGILIEFDAGNYIVLRYLKSTLT